MPAIPRYLHGNWIWDRTLRNLIFEIVFHGKRFVDISKNSKDVTVNILISFVASFFCHNKREMPRTRNASIPGVSITCDSGSAAKKVNSSAILTPFPWIFIPLDTLVLLTISVL